MVFGKLDEASLYGKAHWGEEAEAWAKKRAKESKSWKEGDFMVTEKILTDGIKVIIQHWLKSKRLAQVTVQFPDETVKQYQARYEHGQAQWLLVSGGIPDSFPEGEGLENEGEVRNNNDSWKQEQMF